MHRRDFLRHGAAALAASSAARAFGIVVQDAGRPATPCGVATGDVADGRAIVWSRTDRPARLIVEYSTTPSFRDPRRIAGPAALEATDYTARVDLSDLPPGQRISYRVHFQDLSDLRVTSVPVEGSFQTPSRQPDRDVVFSFSADCVGQGWGIDPAHGGIALYEAMRRAEPDVFIHLGDTIYADQPLSREVTLDDGSVWRNIVTEAKAKIAQDLADYRGNHLYNFHDEHLKRFASEVSQMVLWDDHEVRDNWYPTQRLDADARDAVNSVALLAARGKRAFLEYQPLRIDPIDAERIYRSWRYGPLVEIFALDMRTYRGANSANVHSELDESSAILGNTQVSWLKRALAASTSTWKVIASDLPIGLVVRDGAARFEAIANKNDGPPLGRELEIAQLLAFIRDRSIRNVIWITADVHYAAAHHYDPSRARFTDFAPFWEFVAGPLHAGTFGPNALDRTFGPEVRFLSIPPGMKPNRPPSDGLQFFGLGRIDRRTKALTMQIQNRKGETVYSIELAADRIR
jgi:alkaline phosphatase D